MNDSQKLILKHQAMDSGIIPETKSLQAGAWIKNAERTGDDNATVGSCWKEFWQIFTLKDFPTKCPFCGMPMKEDEVNGCHIKIRGFGLL